MRRFGFDEIGSASIELVLLTPFMLWGILASYAYFDAMNTRTKSLNASQVISDLLSRQTEVSEDFIKSLDAVFDSISNVRDPEKAWLRVSVVVGTETDSELLWSLTTSTKAAELTTIEAIRRSFQRLEKVRG